MSLRHTLKSLIAGPQTQAPSGGFNGYSSPPPPPQELHPAPGLYGQTPQNSTHSGSMAQQGSVISADGYQNYGGGYHQAPAQNQFAYPPAAPHAHSYQQPQQHPPVSQFSYPYSPPQALYNNHQPLSHHQPFSPAQDHAYPQAQFQQYPPMQIQAHPQSQPSTYTQPHTVTHSDISPVGQIASQPSSQSQVFEYGSSQGPPPPGSPPPPPYSQASPHTEMQTLSQTSQISHSEFGSPPPVPISTHPNNNPSSVSSIPQKQAHQIPFSPSAQQFWPPLKSPVSNFAPKDQVPAVPVSTPSLETPITSPTSVPVLPGTYTSAHPFSSIASNSVSAPSKPPHSQSASITSPIPIDSSQFFSEQRLPVSQSNSSATSPTATQYAPFRPAQQVQSSAFNASSNDSSKSSNAEIALSPTGKIHPSMLTQWSSATAIKSGQIPTLPSSHPQSPPSLASPSDIGQSPPPQPKYPGHKSSSSVSRSLTFSKRNADGSPNWDGLLISIDGMPSETFTRLVDGIYNFAGASEDPEGLTPDQMRVLLERLGTPDQENHPKRLGSLASQLQQAERANFVNTNLTPLITREGFNQYMISDVLIDPASMHSRLNRLLTNFGHYIIDPSSKKPFGSIEIQRKSYPLIPNDQYVSRNKKQLEVLIEREKSHPIHSPSASGGSAYQHQGSWGI